MDRECYSITPSLIKIKCDKCSCYRFKNGNLRANPKIKYHIHGNDNNFNNRIEVRTSHCPLDEFEDIHIHITDKSIIKK